MAITTLDQLVAGMLPAVEFLKVASVANEAAGVWRDLNMSAPGLPGQASPPSGGLNGTILSDWTTWNGCLRFPAAAGGKRSYLARLECRASQAGALLLADRLWHNSDIVATTTTEQAITSPTWPARDAAGSTLGEGVLVALAFSSNGSNGAVTNTTLRYTNSDGTPNRTGTILSYPATANLGTFVPFALQSGDRGIRSVEGITLGTSYVSGTMHLVAYRPLASVAVVLAHVGEAADAVKLGMPWCYDGTCPFLLWLPSTTTAPTVQGQIVYSQG